MNSDNKQHVGWYAIANIWLGGVVGLPALLLGSELVSTLTFEKILPVGFFGYAFVVATCAC